MQVVPFPYLCLVRTYYNVECAYFDVNGFVTNTEEVGIQEDNTLVVASALACGKTCPNQTA